MAQETRGAFKRSSVTKMLIAELNRITHALPKPEGQYEAQTYLSPAGRVVAKVMICGTAVEKEDIGKDQPLWRLRITDPSGTTQVYAGGMYQPEAAQAIATLDLPAFVAVVGKLHLYEPEGAGGNIIVSLRPDSITILSNKGQDSKGRDDFLLDAALSTLRSVRSTSDETTIYGDKDGKDAYMFVARQALESLLTYDDKAGEEKGKSMSDADATKKQDKQESTQGATTTSPAPPKLESGLKPATTSPSPNQKRESPAYPRKEQKKEEKKEPAPAPAKGKVGKEIDDSIKTVQEVIMDVLKEQRGNVRYGELPELLKLKGVNPLMADWESAVKRLMTEGLICEPRLGVLRQVS